MKSMKHNSDDKSTFEAPYQVRDGCLMHTFNICVKFSAMCNLFQIAKIHILLIMGILWVFCV